MGIMWNKSGFKKNSKIPLGTQIFIKCDLCGLEKSIGCRKTHFNGYLCRTCKGKEIWRRPGYQKKMAALASNRNKWTEKRRAKVSNNAKLHWQEQEYIEKQNKTRSAPSYKKSASENSKKLWENAIYRCKMAKISKENKTPESKERFSEIAKELWNRKSYKAKQHASHCNPNYRRKMSSITKKMWEDEEYRRKTTACWKDPVYKEKMTQIFREIWSNPEYRIQMKEIFNDPKQLALRSKNSKALWEDSEYREKMAAIFKDPEFLKKMSATTKALWEDPEYKEKTLAAIKELWENPEYREKVSAAVKAMWQDPSYREKMAAIYNSPEYREKMAIVRSQQPTISSIQKILYSWLDDLGVEYEIEKPIGFYTFDCFIPKYNILIECQGDYWHSLKKNITNDKAKATYIERYFPQYQLKCLWEHEFYAKDRVIGVIKHWLGLDTLELVDFNFNNTEIRKVKHCDVKLLLSKYHYLQNAGSGGIIYGAYLKDKLVACCVFSSPTRKEIATRLKLQPKEIKELSRFCIHPSYQKKNFGSWFISRCLKDLESAKKYRLVVSFCDTTYNHDGALYKATNFILDGKTKPDYWYADKDGYVMHKKTLYQRAIKIQMKEKEYAEKNGYLKVWGKEKLRFTYNF